MNEAVVYIHGKGGNSGEANHYKALFPECDVTGFDYKAETPWEAETEFTHFFGSLCEKYGSVSIIANSIGAYFAMCSLNGMGIKKAFFISPVIDMEKLICDMMKQAGITEEELYGKKEIGTASGETLSWKYLCYTREHPVKWDVPTHIIYGEKDMLTSHETVLSFASQTGATVDVMKDGEHRFHTDEQMRFIDRSILGNILTEK